MEREDIRKKLSILIGKVLYRKGMCGPKKYQIAIVLAESVLKNREKRVKGVHRALFQWINNNDLETITM